MKFETMRFHQHWALKGPNILVNINEHNIMWAWGKGLYTDCSFSVTWSLKLPAFVFSIAPVILKTGCTMIRRITSPRHEFLEDHNESEVGGIPRHWMDQQVFNKFVQKKLFHSSSDLVHGLYEKQLFPNVRVNIQAIKLLRIRILNPIIVAHGMNYFWLRAHERHQQRPPMGWMERNVSCVIGSFDISMILRTNFSNQGLWPISIPLACCLQFA